MPGYEPFLLCDFHVHTTWSDGRLSLREVVDLYGQTGRFDVIAITDHILMERDLLRTRRDAEDQHVDALVQQGLKSKFAPRGRYSWQEGAQRQFNVWLVDRYRTGWDTYKGGRPQ